MNQNRLICRSKAQSTKHTQCVRKQNDPLCDVIEGLITHTHTHTHFIWMDTY